MLHGTSVGVPCLHRENDSRVDARRSCYLRSSQVSGHLDPFSLMTSEKPSAVCFSQGGCPCDAGSQRRPRLVA